MTRNITMARPYVRPRFEMSVAGWWWSRITKAANKSCVSTKKLFLNTTSIKFMESKVLKFMESKALWCNAQISRTFKPFNVCHSHHHGSVQIPYNSIVLESHYLRQITWKAHHLDGGSWSCILPVPLKESYSWNDCEVSPQKVIYWIYTRISLNKQLI